MAAGNITPPNIMQTGSPTIHTNLIVRVYEKRISS